MLSKDQLFELCKDHQNTLKAFTNKESTINNEMNFQEGKCYKKSTFINSDQQYKIKLIKENKSTLVELKNMDFSCSSSSSFSMDCSSTLDNNIDERSIEKKENCEMSSNIKRVSIKLIFLNIFLSFICRLCFFRKGNFFEKKTIFFFFFLFLPFYFEILLRINHFLAFN